VVCSESSKRLPRERTGEITTEIGAIKSRKWFRAEVGGSRLARDGSRPARDGSRPIRTGVVPIRDITIPIKDGAILSRDGAILVEMAEAIGNFIPTTRAKA